MFFLWCYLSARRWLWAADGGYLRIVKQWFYGILGLSLFGTVVEVLVPESGRDSMRKMVKLVVALCFLLAVLGPFLGNGAAVPDLSALLSEGEKADYEALGEEKFQIWQLEQVKDAVVARLTAQFGIAEQDCRVSASLNEAGDALAGIWITLRGKALLTDPRAVENLISSDFSCPCTVVVG